MALCRTQLQCLVITVFMHFCAVHCDAQSPSGIPLSVCNYTLTSFYVVNTVEPSAVFPTGYVSCANATGSDTGLCEICSCREKKVGSAAGVTVSGAVCVGSGDATTCVGQEQEYCHCNDSADCSVGTAFLRDGSSNNKAMSDGDVLLATDSVNLTNGSDISAKKNSTSSPSRSSNSTAESTIDNALPTIDNRSSSDASLNLDTKIDTTIPVIAPESVSLSIDTDRGSSNVDGHLKSEDSSDHGSRSTDSNTADTNASMHTSIDAGTNSISKPASSSIGYSSNVTEPAVENDNVASDVAGTVKSSQTGTALLADQNVSTQENGSTLDTNSGSASNSSWSSERLTTIFFTICGTGIVAAIAVFVVTRRGQFKKEKELGTPTDDYVNDGTSIVTPTNYSDHGARYYSEGNHTVRSFEHTPLGAIAVIGFDDALLNSPSSVSKHQFRSYSGAERNASEDTYARTASHIAGKDVVVRDSRPSSAVIQLVSNGPSVSVLRSPTSTPIFDTSYSRESFSSDMSSQSESSSDELFRESEVSFDSFRMVCRTSRGIDHDSESSTNSRSRQASSESEENAAWSSVSSLDSVQYDFRDTEASEHMRESEMNTDSSHIAISFDTGSCDSKGL